MSEKEGRQPTPRHRRTRKPAADRSRRRRFRDAAVVLELLPGHGDPRRGDPRLRSESPAVRHRPAGRQGEPADRDELLHGQAAPDGPGDDDPAARGDLRLDRARRPPPRVEYPTGLHRSRTSRPSGRRRVTSRSAFTSPSEWVSRREATRLAQRDPLLGDFGCKDGPAEIVVQ